tara:strand:- start:4110 stop:5642 length:1533 start_codon:yes stop_codon:yes gene_type:complete
MADNLKSFQVSCGGGLNTGRDLLSQGETQPGSAIALINYEPALTGGYRRISGFANSYGTVAGLGDILGVAVANGINNGILACRTPSAGNNYLHYWDGTVWQAVTTAGSPTMTGVTKVRFSPFNFGTPKVMLTDGINPAATYDGTTYTQITHASAPTDPKYSTEFQSHVFLAGDPAADTNVYFSAPYAETDFAVANGAGVINVGFPVVAMKPFRDALYIFGTNNIRKLTGSSAATFAVENVTDDLGCLASDSVIEIGGDLLFLSQDGLRPISGTSKIGDVNLETVSKDIQSIITGVVLALDLDGLNAVVIRSKSQFRLMFGSADSQGIIGALRPGENGLRYEYGQLLGIEATASASGYIGQSEFVIHGDSTGKVHRQELGNDFDGEAIFSAFQTPFFHMEDPEVRKIIYSVSTYLRSEGDGTIVLGVEYDYQNPNTLAPTNYDMTVSGVAAYYSEALYDSTAIFDGNPSPVFRTNVTGSGKSVAMRYVTSGTEASHTIQGIVITYGLGDRL